MKVNVEVRVRTGGGSGGDSNVWECECFEEKKKVARKNPWQISPDVYQNQIIGLC